MLSHREMASQHSNTSSHSSPAGRDSSVSLPTAVVCRDDDDAVLDAVIGKVVKNTVFPKKQFIILDKELDANGKLASKCLKALNMEKTKWHLIKDLIRKRLNNRRNNCQLGIRRSIKRKWYKRCLILN
jgi:hypothetical protein